MTEDVEALLRSLRAERTDTRGRLHDLRARTRDIRAEFGARVRADPDGLPQAIIEALVAASSGELAPVAFRRIRERVEEGLYTWTDLYADPEGVAGPEGRELVRRAVHVGVSGADDADDADHDTGGAGGTDQSSHTTGAPPSRE